PGTGGFGRVEGVRAHVGMDPEYGMPFMDMINGLASIDKLSGTYQYDIRNFTNHTLNYENYYDRLIPSSLGYGYSLESVDDSTLIAKLGKVNAGDSIFCYFGFKKSGADRSWSFSSIDLFRNLLPDAEAIADGMRTDRPQMAGYHFTLEAGKVNSPGDTSWYEVKGWSSCWKFFDITAISANMRPLYRLPESFTANCNCNNCIEMNNWQDSLYTEYPGLYPTHPNYQTIVPNYI